jgi:hypothetical protein
MTTPKNWQPGEPITADRLNTGNAESLRPRRSLVLGNGSSLVNETLGNQSASAKAPSIKLVVAIEDFLIPETPTDLNGVVDDVPSGLVREVRLNRKSGTHVKDESQKPFRAYDVTAGLTGVFCESTSDSASASSSGSASSSTSDAALSGKSLCDVFYVMFNTDSKRWEVMAAGGSGTTHILFEIVRVARGFGLNCNAMECLILNVSCSSAISLVGTEVIVYDELGCVFNAPEPLLLGIRGYAKKMSNASSLDPLVFEPGTEDIAAPTGSCRWSVDRLCCVEEDDV